MLPAFQQVLNTLPDPLRLRPWILAISGGLDSVALLHLLLASGVRPVLAHANFGLRGAESDADEQLVRELALKFKLQLEIRCFGLGEEGKIPGGVSLQEEARRLRYAWFEELQEIHGASLILTAHHLQDNWETFWINLLRGSGVQGLKGMPLLEKQYFRPLLSFSREEIMAWSQVQLLSWREDSSNSKDDYLRNRIRHHLTPRMSEVDTDWLQRFEKTRQNLAAQSQLLAGLLHEWEQQHIRQLEYYQRIRFPGTSGAVPLDLLKQELLVRRGCPRNLVPEIVAAERTGALFSWNKTELLVDRGNWLIREAGVIPLSRHAFLNWAQLPFELPAGIVLAESDRAVAELFLDNREHYTFRRLQPGDTMRLKSGRKKLSDILVDAKLNRFMKEQLLVLCREDEIVWLPGFAVAAAYLEPDAQRQHGLRFNLYPY